MQRFIKRFGRDSLIREAVRGCYIRTYPGSMYSAPVPDKSPVAINNVDDSKTVRFELGGLSTNTDAVITVTSNGTFPDPSIGTVTIGSPVVGGTGNRILYETGPTPVVADSANLTFNGTFFNVAGSVEFDNTNIAAKGLVVKNIAAQTANNFEAQSSVGTPYFTIGPDVLAGDATTKNLFNVTGTLPAVTTAGAYGANFQITGAGSSAQQQRAVNVNLIVGYTGASSTVGMSSVNQSLGTGTGGFAATSGNFGVVTDSRGIGSTGNNIGNIATALGSTSLNLALYGRANNASSSPALNVGVAGCAFNATVNIGGFFGLTAGTPTLAATAALMCDNGVLANDIFVARDNGTAIFTIADGGVTAIAAGLTAASLSTAGNVTGLNHIGGNVAALITSNVTMNDGAGAGAGTILNAPSVGNPTKWVPINDNGTTRFIPTW